MQIVIGYSVTCQEKDTCYQLSWILLANVIQHIWESFRVERTEFIWLIDDANY